jgi:hypothetical protein
MRAEVEIQAAISILEAEASAVCRDQIRALKWVLSAAWIPKSEPVPTSVKTRTPKKHIWKTERVTNKVSVTKSVPLAGRGGSAPFPTPKICPDCGMALRTPSSWSMHRSRMHPDRASSAAPAEKSG